jgi:hypothetical protein
MFWDSKFGHGKPHKESRLGDVSQVHALPVARKPRDYNPCVGAGFHKNI